jgi:hypothetical protein
MRSAEDLIAMHREVADLLRRRRVREISIDTERHVVVVVLEHWNQRLADGLHMRFGDGGGDRAS